MNDSIEVGCLVACVDNSGVEHLLTNGNIYDVTMVDALGNLRVDNIDYRFAADRFEKRTAPIPDAETVQDDWIDDLFKTEPTMRVNDNEQIYGFDVDNTLVSVRRAKYSDGDIRVVNPYTKLPVYVRPHMGHIDLLKEMHGRGRYIRVHSAAGVKWAMTIVKALGLEPYVHDVETKMVGYVDDMPVEQWLKNHIYLGETERT